MRYYYARETYCTCNDSCVCTDSVCKFNTCLLVPHVSKAEMRQTLNILKVLVHSLLSTLQAFSADSLPPGTVLPQGRIQHMSIQPWIRAPGTHYCWVDRGNVGWEACLRILLMTSVGNRTPDPLICGPLPSQLGYDWYWSRLYGMQIVDHECAYSV